MTLMILFVILLLVGAPIAIAVGLSSLVVVYLDGISLQIAAQRMFAGLNSFTLMAIPFFIFAGDLMLVGGSSKRLIEMAKKLVGWITGGLPIAGVLASMFFSAVSGSSPATVAAIGGVMIPSLKEAKYSDNFSVGLMCAAGSLGIIIPPSITLLVYGVVAEVSIGKLFLAGVIPGIFIGVVLIGVSYVIAKKQGHQPDKRASLSEVWKATKDGFWALMMPIIVLGGIYAGFFTPTEAAAVAIVYSLIIGMFIYKELDVKKLFEVAKKSVVTSSMIMLIISAATIFSWYLTYQQIPTQVASEILKFATQPVIFLLTINLLLLFIGMIMDPSATVLILVPLLLPVAVELGIDPVHFGVIMIVNLAIGMLTPPFGLNLFVASGISKLSLSRVTMGVLPFVGVLIITLLIITFVPQLSLFLPQSIN